MKKGEEKEKKKKSSVLINDALSKTANNSQPRTPVTQHRANKCEKKKKKRGAAQTDLEEVNEVSSAQRRAGYWDWEVGVGVSGEEGGVSDGGGGEGKAIRTNTIFTKNETEKSSAASMLG